MSKDLDALIDKEFDNVYNLAKTDTSIKTFYDSGVYALNYICSKNIYGAYPKGRIIGIDGLSGTGKSLLAATAMRDPKIDMVVIVESEGGGHSQELLEFAGVDKSKVKILKASTLVSYKLNKKTGDVEEIGDKEIPKTKDTDKYLYVEGAGYLIRKLANLVQFNKIEKNILIILDSLGNMQSIRGLGGGFDMGKRGQDMTNFFKNFDNEFEKSGLTFIFTNKLYQSLDISGPRYVATGGESPIYNSSIYLRLSETVDSDDISDGERKEEKDRRQTSLGSSIKTIKAKIIKSRFGTEFRNVPFLLDFAVGPVRMSGLFRLLKDFGVIVNTGGAWYEAPGIIDKKFYKKDFVDIVLSDEKNYINKFQEKLQEKERELKEARKNIQANDEEEISETGILNEDIVSDLDDMKSQMIKDMENK
jgi:RecA/RadA recombinase